MSSSIIMFLPGYAVLRDDYSSLACPSSNGSAENGTANGCVGRKFMKATGSCCLVGSSGNLILFDTMGPWEKDLLIEKLASYKVHPDDISCLVCSHSHPDHIGNLNLFTKAKKHFIGTSVYTNDLYDLNCFEPTGSYKYSRPNSDAWVENPEYEVITYQAYNINSNISLVPTPGHTMECISMLINNCDTLGRVALVGDLFENKNDVADETIWLGAGSQNPDLQRASRARIYSESDYIFPGHGDFFQTDPAKKL